MDFTSVAYLATMQLKTPSGNMDASVLPALKIALLRKA